MENQGESTEYDYVAQGTQIGGGFLGMKPLAQNGAIVINDGMFFLYGTQGQLIDQAPLTGVVVKRLWFTAGASARVYLNGNSYTVTAGFASTSLGGLAPLPSLTLGVSSSATGRFIKTFKTLSGQQ